MSEFASSNYTFSQEDSFSQYYAQQIAPFWQQRQHGYSQGTNGSRLYWISLTSPKHTKAIMVVNGRIESTWKYQELFFDLFQQGYDIYSYDHQGQGLSDRLTENPELGHVMDFGDYVDDMALMVEQFGFSRYEQSFYWGIQWGSNHHSVFANPRQSPVCCNGTERPYVWGKPILVHAPSCEDS